MAALDGRVVLVTGATGVLGRVVAGRFAAAGARLGLLGTHPEPLTDLARDLGLAADRWAPGTGDLATATRLGRRLRP